jgi:hypothetical protein
MGRFQKLDIEKVASLFDTTRLVRERVSLPHYPYHLWHAQRSDSFVTATALELWRQLRP